MKTAPGKKEHPTEDYVRRAEAPNHPPRGPTSTQPQKPQRRFVMASISNVRLQIVEKSGSAKVLVSYRLNATHGDGANEQAYRELVQLVGVDAVPGEDGHNELIRSEEHTSELQSRQYLV